jgi:hypothetical protein
MESDDTRNNDHSVANDGRFRRLRRGRRADGQMREHRHTHDLHIEAALRCLRSEPEWQNYPKRPLVIPDAISAGDLNQAEFETAVESRCGKIK